MSELKPQPSLFLPHGAPDLPLTSIPAADFLRRLSSQLPQRPDGIVIISAHWMIRGLGMTAPGPLETIHDFGGFSPELYRLTYNARGTADLSAQVQEVLAEAGQEIAQVQGRGLDHGAWVPLLMVYPEADIPVVQISLDATRSARELVALGHALEPLRERNILIIGSGASVHNLRRIAPEGSSVPEWARSFDDWVSDTLDSGDVATLADFEAEAPAARQAHPTTEHFLPLFVAAGAGGTGNAARKLHESFSYGSIGMSAWAFGGEEQ
ncbi:dioxygenase [Roseibium sp.]|uniref:dioxygenase family protein n=1 Tax=Roseibium sp. TaxID=1936156 RepID=UPI003A96B4AE